MNQSVIFRLACFLTLKKKKKTIGAKEVKESVDTFSCKVITFLSIVKATEFTLELSKKICFLFAIIR